jgi:hypothetical protein
MCKQLSSDPLARWRPSAEKATEYTGSRCLSSTWQQRPDSGSHSRIVVSNEADASSGGDPGLADPAPVGAHLIVYTSFVCFRRSWTGPSRASDHIFAV